MTWHFIQPFHLGRKEKKCYQGGNNNEPIVFGSEKLFPQRNMFVFVRFKTFFVLLYLLPVRKLLCFQKFQTIWKSLFFLSDHFFSITTNRSTGTGSSKSDVLKMFWLLSRFVFFAISWLKLNISKITVTCEICSFVDCPQVVVCLLLFGIFQCGTCCCKPLLNVTQSV